MKSPVVGVVAVLLATLLSGAGNTGEPGEPAPVPENVEPPAISGEVAYRELLRASPGTWTPEEGLTFDYRWLRDGRRVRGETTRRYRPRLRDLGSRLELRVIATDEAGDRVTATSEPTIRVRRAEFTSLERPGISGSLRYTRVLSADAGRWAPRRHGVSYRWMRAGEPIKGATGARYRLQPEDVGRRLQVKVWVRAEGYRAGAAISRRTSKVLHRVPVRRTVTYRIETKGRIVADRDVFRRQVAETFADPQGWRSAGVQLRRVASGGAFSVVLAEASTLPSYSSVCSTQWSCRVGRYVVINQTRWRSASPSWNAAGQPLRGYRHMVLNHETGHWLGHGHLGCPGRGRQAPVMMQQSKGLGGCSHNPWPLASELWSR